MYERILVPIDGSACGDVVVAYGVSLATAARSKLSFLHVIDTFADWHEGFSNEELAVRTTRGRSILDRAETVALEAGLRNESELIEGSPVEVIARRMLDFDLVVMGSHRSGLRKQLSGGSVTQAILHHMTCPLLVVPCVQEGHSTRRPW